MVDRWSSRLATGISAAHLRKLENDAVARPAAGRAGGSLVPARGHAGGFRAFAQFLPTTWAMNGFDEVILRGGGLAAVLPSVAILLAIAAALLLVAMRRLRLD